MNFQHLWRTARTRLHRQSGAFDFPSIMIGVAVVDILTVSVLAAIFGVIPWSQDKAAQQYLVAVHDAQGVAFAKDGGFKDTKSSESWYLNGDLHRVGGPAQIGYTADESIISAQWYAHGQLHRLDGPADYVLEESGNYMAGQERWFIRGEAIHSRDALVQAGGDPANWPEHWG